MSDACRCHAPADGGPGNRGRTLTSPAVLASETVQAIADRSPHALETLKRLGINHCCGAHLTLIEAAAAAGVPLATLLAELEPALAGDVTG